MSASSEFASLKKSREDCWAIATYSQTPRGVTQEHRPDNGLIRHGHLNGIFRTVHKHVTGRPKPHVTRCAQVGAGIAEAGPVHDGAGRRRDNRPIIRTGPNESSAVDLVRAGRSS